jgi:hypothetical protein
MRLWNILFYMQHLEQPFRGKISMPLLLSWRTTAAEILWGSLKNLSDTSRNLHLGITEAMIRSSCSTLTDPYAFHLCICFLSLTSWSEYQQHLLARRKTMCARARAHTHTHTHTSNYLDHCFHKEPGEKWRQINGFTAQSASKAHMT